VGRDAIEPSGYHFFSGAPEQDCLFGPPAGKRAAAQEQQGNAGRQ
jgi:hypothetical protein